MTGSQHREQVSSTREAKWTGVAFLVAAGLVNFLDRSSLSIANPSVRAELGLSATGIGMLLSAFSLAYGFAQLPIGPLLDRYGARRLLRAGLGLWSLAQLVTGFVQTWSFFVVLRLLLGLGEAPFFPASVKIVEQMFRPRERGRPMAAVNISTTAGQALAPPLLTAFMLAFGWRYMFVSIGGLGIALAMAWKLAQPGEAAQSNNTSEQGRAAETLPVDLKTWASLFRQRTVWGLMIGFGGINYTAWFYIAWLPSYLESERHISVRSSGWLAAVPFLAGSLGMYFSGIAADACARAGQRLRSLHRRQILLGMTVSAFSTLLAAHAKTSAIAIAEISLALLSIHFAGTSAWGYVQAASPRQMVATVSSIQNFGSFLFASAAPVLTGLILDLNRSFGNAFLLCAVVTLAGAGSYLVLVRDPVQQPL